MYNIEYYSTFCGEKGGRILKRDRGTSASSLRRKAAMRSEEGAQWLWAMLETMRPWHYGKNLLVFVPLFFSGQLFANLQALRVACMGFVVMCLTASGVYAINDCADVERDRENTAKRSRPIASGRMSPGVAKALAAALLLAAAALLAAGRFPPAATAWWAVYVAVNVGYSMFEWKNIPVWDVTIVALGFVLRILYGAELTGTPASKWMLLTVLTGSYYMALGKRRNELSDIGASARPVLGLYTRAFLDRSMYMFLTLTVVFYALWSVDDQTVARYLHGYTVCSVPVVILWVLHYSLNIEKNGQGDPVEVILHDRKLLGLGAAYIALMFCLIYAKG